MLHPLKDTKGVLSFFGDFGKAPLFAAKRYKKDPGGGYDVVRDIKKEREREKERAGERASERITERASERVRERGREREGERQREREREKEGERGKERGSATRAREKKDTEGGYVQVRDMCNAPCRACG